MWRNVNTKCLFCRKLDDHLFFTYSKTRKLWNLKKQNKLFPNQGKVGNTCFLISYSRENQLANLNIRESVHLHAFRKRNWSTTMIISILIIHKPLWKMSFADKILSPFLRSKLLENSPCIKGIKVSSFLPENFQFHR